MAAAERHREHVAKWFYDLDHRFHLQLGELYVNDPRFAGRHDKARPGLAAYVRDAIAANSERATRT